MNTEMIEALRGAKEYLFENGWRRGDYGYESGPVCLAGACFMVQFGNMFEDSILNEILIDTLNGVIQQETGYPHIAAFNDSIYTAFDDVIDIIDKTIKTLEG